MTKKIFKSLLIGVAILAVLIGLITISYAADTPTINSFTVDSNIIQSGQSTNLHWNVSNAKRLELVGIGDQVNNNNLSLKGNMAINPSTPATYVLNAYGANGSMISATVDVNIGSNGEAQIVSFTSSSYKIDQGNSVKLEWTLKNVKDAEVIALEKIPEKEIPTTHGSLDVWPYNTTTYILQVTGFQGEVLSKYLTVQVGELTNPSTPTPTATPTPTPTATPTPTTTFTTTVAPTPKPTPTTTNTNNNNQNNGNNNNGRFGNFGNWQRNNNQNVGFVNNRNNRNNNQPNNRNNSNRNNNLNGFTNSWGNPQLNNTNIRNNLAQADPENTTPNNNFEFGPFGNFN
jgi:cell division septation protein DedD